MGPSFGLEESSASMAGAVKIVLIAFGLAADAFAVSIAEGIVVEEATHRHALRVSVMFGLFQGVMPILGWLAGEAIRSRLAGVDHWVAFGLLGFVGGKMLLDAVFGIESSGKGKESRGLRLLMLAVATSIDAFAVGLTLAMMDLGIWVPAAVIALITAVLSAIGVQAGSRVGTRFGRKAEAVGGAVLLGLALKIPLEHLGGAV